MCFLLHHFTAGIGKNAEHFFSSHQNSEIHDLGDWNGFSKTDNQYPQDYVKPKSEVGL